MKYLFLTLITVFGLATTTIAQVINQIVISPAKPTAIDTISVISNFTYYGNCSYGLVYSNASLTGSTINITPTYCGYGDSTLCNSIDTFKIGPYPIGNYTISIEYHQGSICPISGFDAIIAKFDTTLTVKGTTSTLNVNFNSFARLFPNPFSYSTTLQTSVILDKAILTVYNSYGQKVKEIKNISGQTVTLYRDNLSMGLYFIRLTQDNKTILSDKLEITD